MRTIWCAAFVFCYVRSFDRVLSECLKPVPSLAEIEQKFRNNGYNPSVQDVLALHQHLTSQRNEAFLATGAMLVATKAMALQAQGKPPL